MRERLWCATVPPMPCTRYTWLCCTVCSASVALLPFFPPPCAPVVDGLRSEGPARPGEGRAALRQAEVPSGVLRRACRRVDAVSGQTDRPTGRLRVFLFYQQALYVLLPLLRQQALCLPDSSVLVAGFHPVGKVRDHLWRRGRSASMREASDGFRPASSAYTRRTNAGLGACTTFSMYE